MPPDPVHPDAPQPDRAPAAGQPPARPVRPRRGRLERRRVAALLRTETVGGVLLVTAAATALAIANTPLYRTYATVRDVRIGPAALHLNLSVQEWTADALLALFFFLAGLELKREFVIGELRQPRRAAVPVAAAIGGMVVPAAIYLAINAGHLGAAVGWAIPTATDIAFALAVLAVVGRHLPSALRTFLLTLAVVDDLLAIVVIALFYTRELHPAYLALSLVPLAAFTIAIQRGHGSWCGRWWVLLPPALVAWALMHASGVHATVAGVLMGFAVPVLGRRRVPARGDAHGRDRRGRRDVHRADGRAAAPGLAERLDHRLRPISAGVAVPLFAFFAAGVSVGGVRGLAAALGDRITVGIVVAMVAGKAVGILAATLVTARVVRSPLLRGLAAVDLVGLALLGGVGFTVSLLIGELAFAGQPDRVAQMRIAVLTGSVVAAVLAGIVLGIRGRHYARRPGVRP